MGVFDMPERKKNILDYIKYDITTFFLSDYREISAEDTPAVQVIDFEKKIPELEFGLFDTLRLRVMFDKLSFTVDTHINATFRMKKRRATTEEIIELTNNLHSIFGVDDTQKEKWDVEDAELLKKFEFHRIWSTGLGDSFVSLWFKETSGLELSILFINNLYEFTGRKIQF